MTNLQTNQDMKILALKITYLKVVKHIKHIAYIFLSAIYLKNWY